MRAVDEDAFLHGVEHDLVALNIQLDAEHQSESANLFHERIFLGEFVQAHAEISAHVDDVRQQLVENIEKLEGHAAGERSAAEGGSVHAGTYCFRCAMVRG